MEGTLTQRKSGSGVRWRRRRGCEGGRGGVWRGRGGRVDSWSPLATECDGDVHVTGVCMGVALGVVGRQGHLVAMEMVAKYGVFHQRVEVGEGDMCVVWVLGEMEREGMVGDEEESRRKKRREKRRRRRQRMRKKRKRRQRGR